MKVGNKRGRIFNKEGETFESAQYIAREERMERENYRNLIVLGKHEPQSTLYCVIFLIHLFKHNLK